MLRERTALCMAKSPFSDVIQEYQEFQEFCAQYKIEQVMMFERGDVELLTTRISVAEMKKDRTELEKKLTVKR
jgi:hypothetical protein